MAETYIPTNGAGMKGASDFSEACKVGKEIFFDRPIKTIWSAGPNWSTTDGLWSFTPGNAHPTVAEINSSGIMAPICNANNEGFGCKWLIPPDCDVSKQIDFRVLWLDNTDAAGTGSAQWAILYKAVSFGATTLAVPTVALDTVIADQADLAVYVPLWTAWGSISAAKSGVTTLVPGDSMLALKVTVTLTTITDADPLLVQCRYYRKYFN